MHAQWEVFYLPQCLGCGTGSGRSPDSLFFYTCFNGNDFYNRHHNYNLFIEPFGNCFSSPNHYYNDVRRFITLPTSTNTTSKVRFLLFFDTTVTIFRPLVPVLLIMCRARTRYFYSIYLHVFTNQTHLEFLSYLLYWPRVWRYRGNR